MFLQRILLVCALCTLISACGGNAPDRAGLKIYKVALDHTPNDVDPAHSATLYQNHLVLNLYDTLYSYKYLARPYELNRDWQ